MIPIISAPQIFGRWGHSSSGWNKTDAAQGR
jgi:hypothetical protein